MKPNLPWGVIVLSAAALLLQLGGDAVGSLFEWRADWATGNAWWRPFTGHLVHWSGSHLLWDLVTFATLGSIIERRSPGRFWCCLLCVALLTELFLRAGSRFDSYRGLSAWSVGLFAQLLLEGAKLGRGGRWFSWPALMAGVGWLALLVKSGLEALGSEPLFVAAGDFSVAAEAHLAGVLSAPLACVLRALNVRIQRADTNRPRASARSRVSR